ncbi:MAG: N-acetyltransferase [Parvibaculum sp.]|uniref:N-acetyltransferase n=1 Tax=Parvibaculum sp. TaxID=2024848 RepID=UPI0034A01A89
MIHDAKAEDVAAMVALIEAARRRLEEWQPQFWRKAEASAAMSEGWFGVLVGNPEIITLVSETDGKIDGFLIAMLQDAPPVYSPGGKTCLIDDFAVAGDDLWPGTGRDLLRTALARARDKGATQTVVVAPDAHTAKKAMLAEEGLSIASTWWTSAL